MLHFGRVSAVDKDKALVKVTLDGLDNNDGTDLVTDWLPCLMAGTLTDKGYYLFDVGEQVALAMDENAEAGVVLGATFNATDAPDPSAVGVGVRALSVKKDGTTVAQFKIDRLADGATLAHVKSSLTLTTDSGDITATAGGKAVVHSTGDTALTSGAKLTAQSSGDMEFTPGGKMKIRATGKASLQAGGQSLFTLLTKIINYLDTLILISGAPGSPTAPNPANVPQILELRTILNAHLE